MPHENPDLTAFRRALGSDASLQDALRAADPDSAADVVAFASEHGFHFGAAELLSIFPLADAELDRVVGGASAFAGEAGDRKHKDWINLLSVSQSITRPMG